ncbi:NUDIX hydrolase [Bryocella elongata]|nr:NUDIX domain-containing protein [Bryocella elongata]
MSLRLIGSVIGAVIFLCFWVLIVKACTSGAPSERGPTFRLRRSARVFLFNEDGELLLIRFVAQRPDGPYTCWVTPGGEVEVGEPDLEAAQRELFEELGIRPALTGPVHEESGGEYLHLGETVRNYDVFFAARCGCAEPVLSGVTEDEIRLMREARWWTLEELNAAREPVFPPRCAQLAGRVLRALA